MEKLKVLLVDDDLTFGCIAVKVLESAGFAVHYQNSLFGIESLIVKLNPNIIILDVMIGDDITFALPRRIFQLSSYLLMMNWNLRSKLSLMELLCIWKSLLPARS